MSRAAHCLGVRGKGGEIKADRVNCPKSFVPHWRRILLKMTRTLLIAFLGL